MSFNWLKFLSLLFLFSSPFFSFFSDNWFLIWISLELNMLSFIFLGVFPKTNLSSNSMLKYFIIQSFSSMLIFFFFIMLKNILLFEYFNLLINISLLLKLGFSPFHFWLTDVSEALSWLNFCIFNSWQKIIPFFLLNYFNFINLSIFIIILSSIMGIILMFNQSSLRKMLIFSSLPHMSWILLSMICSSFMWFFYLMFYSIFFFFLFILNFNMNFSSYFQLLFLNSIKKILLLFTLLNFSGLPPFSGFFPKWFIISIANFYLPLMFLILASLFSCFIYIRFSFFSFYFFKKKKMKKFTFINFFYINFSMTFLFSLLMIF